MKADTKPPAAPRRRNGERKSDPRVSYDDFKEYEGRRYTGMKIGRSHRWHYNPGDWKETKVTPDLWQISYAVTKRRAGHAPEGSGVPVGTEYHWYVLAHQNVRKLDADSYTTSLTGLKFKIAHKRANAEKWSASPEGQRKRMVTFLKGVIADLERQERKAAGVRAGADGRAAAKVTGRGAASHRRAALPRLRVAPPRRRPRARRTTVLDWSHRAPGGGRSRSRGVTTRAR